MIIINSSDLGYGIRFSFIQEYFDLPCSELSTYPVAAAVAATEPYTEMDTSKKEPSAAGVIGAVSGLQLERYDVDSMRLVNSGMQQVVADLSTPERPVKFHFINVSLLDIKRKDTLQFFNEVPTSFKLNDEQVDKLIEAGRELLRTNPDFQELLTDIASQ